MAIWPDSLLPKNVWLTFMLDIMLLYIQNLYFVLEHFLFAGFLTSARSRKKIMTITCTLINNWWLKEKYLLKSFLRTFNLLMMITFTTLNWALNTQSNSKESQCEREITTFTFFLLFEVVYIHAVKRIKHERRASEWSERKKRIVML